MYRLLKPNGELYLTTSNIDGFFIINKIKDMIGLNIECYGHVRARYTLLELKRKLQKFGF